MESSKRDAALKAQESFRIADHILQSEKVPTFAIYTKTASDLVTDHEYFVKAIARPSGYEVTGVYHQNSNGDGTVPEYSARGGDYCRALRVVNCKHAFMCESSDVLDWLSQTTSTLVSTGKA